MRKALILTVAACLTLAACSKSNTSDAVAGDERHFVNLTDAVPDAILEIRYFGASTATCSPPHCWCARPPTACAPSATS